MTAVQETPPDATEAALVAAYAHHFAQSPDGLKALRHSMLRGPSAALRELAFAIADAQPADGTLVPGTDGQPDTGTAPRGAWQAMVAQVAWLQGEDDAVTLTRFRAIRGRYGLGMLSGADVTAYLACGGASLAHEERAALQSHPTLKGSERASAASDAAADDSGTGSPAHVGALASILGIPESVTLKVRAGAETGPAALSTKTSILNRAKSALRDSGAAASVTVVISPGTAAEHAITSASLEQQVHAKITVVTRATDESLAAVVARAPGDLLLFLSAGSWAAPTLAKELASAVATADGALAAVPSAQRIDANLRFAPANGLLRAADPGSALIHRDAFSAAGPLIEVPVEEALDEFISRLRRVRGKSSTTRVATPTLVLHPAIPLELTDTVIPTQDWRAAFRATVAESTSTAPAMPGALPFAVAPTADTHFDVVFASTLSRSGWKGGSQQSLLQEIRALSGRGLRLGLLHLEAPRVGGHGAGQLSEAFQRLIDEGSVTRLAITDRVTADVLTIRYPPVLQFSPDLPDDFVAGHSGIAARRVIIEANQGPAESDGSDRRYILADCDATVRAVFGTDATWYPQGPLIRRQLIDEGLAPQQLGETDLPGLLDPSDWAIERSSLVGRRPVVGRYSRDHAHKWPDDWRRVLEVYGSPAFDFRSMGGHDAVDELRAGEVMPATWTLLGYNELSTRDFLAGIDFFVYFHHSLYVEAFGRAVAEAMASGAVVILPQHFAPVFGGGALYCEPGDVAKLVAELAADPAAYAAQSAAGAAYAAQNFGYEKYANVIDTLREGPA